MPSLHVAHVPDVIFVVLTLSNVCDYKLPYMSSVRHRPKVGRHSSGIH
jgi:hypothetical protein